MAAPVSETGEERALYRRGQFLTALNRWLSLGLGLFALGILWSAPNVQPLPALAVGTGYATFAVIVHLWQRRFGRSRALKVAHDVVDALAVGTGAAFSGGTSSPLWLFLYPHIVAVSVRGGLLYALAMGLLDAVIVSGLGVLSGSSSLSPLYGASLLWCAFMGGTVSSYLHQIQMRLGQANASLLTRNDELRRTLATAEESRVQQDEALSRLRASEERYRRLLERIQDGVVILSEGKIVFVNRVFAAMVGDTPDGLSGVDLLELIPDENQADISERYQRWQDSQAGAGELVTLLRPRQGRALTVSLRAGSVEWEGRRATITTVRDITRERRMEQEVKAHAARLAAINEIANAVNQSLTIEDIFHVAAEEARRIAPFDWLTIALIDESSPRLELVAVGAGARRQRSELKREDVAWAFRRPMTWYEGGEEPLPRHLHEILAEKSFKSAATLPLVSKERVIGALCLGRFKPEAFTASDLAVMEPVASHVAIALDNARLIEAVRRRGREFESLVEIGRRIVERLEPSEIFPLVTRSVNRLLGTHFCVLMLREGDHLVVAAQEGLEAEVVKSFHDLPVGGSLSGWVAREGRPLSVPDMRKDARGSFPELLDRFGYCSYLCVPLLRGEETLGTLEVVTKEPRSFGAEDQAILTAFADAAAVAIDHARLFQETRSHVSELAEANRRLEDLDRLRQEYLRNVSHEFRTPLTVIRGYAEYLQGAEPPDPKSLRDTMRIVIESCDRVIDMVDTLIEVSRVEQGAAAATLHVQRLDLKELVTSSLETLQGQAARKGVKLAVELPKKGVEVRGDAGLLQQVVRKLVDNAIKYSAKDSRVRIAGREARDHVELLVEDDGVGISAEHLPRIFEKFYMGDGGLTRRVGGAGVGLYLVREILKLHDAQVAVTSEPGKGARFTVQLPRRSLPEAAPRQ